MLGSDIGKLTQGDSYRGRNCIPNRQRVITMTADHQMGVIGQDLRKPKRYIFAPK